jgi:hypothetical protein
MNSKNHDWSNFDDPNLDFLIIVLLGRGVKIVYEIVYIFNLCNYVATKSLQLLCHYIIFIVSLLYKYYATILQLHRQECANDVLTNHQ